MSLALLIMTTILKSGQQADTRTITPKVQSTQIPVVVQAFNGYGTEGLNSAEGDTIQGLAQTIFTETLRNQLKKDFVVVGAKNAATSTGGYILSADLVHIPVADAKGGPYSLTVRIAEAFGQKRVVAQWSGSSDSLYTLTSNRQKTAGSTVGLVGELSSRAVHSLNAVSDLEPRRFRSQVALESQLTRLNEQKGLEPGASVSVIPKAIGGYEVKVVLPATLTGKVYAFGYNPSNRLIPLTDLAPLNAMRAEAGKTFEITGFTSESLDQNKSIVCLVQTEDGSITNKVVRPGAGPIRSLFLTGSKLMDIAELADLLVSADRQTTELEQLVHSITPLDERRWSYLRIPVTPVLNKKTAL